ARREGRAERTVFAYTTTSGAVEVAIVGGRSINGSAPFPVASANFFAADSNAVLSQTATLPLPVYGARALPTINYADPQWVIAGGVTGSLYSPALGGFTVFDAPTRSFRLTSVQAPLAGNVGLAVPRAGFDAALLGGPQITP